jgi:hypothetical protein
LCGDFSRYAGQGYFSPQWVRGGYDPDNPAAKYTHSVTWPEWPGANYPHETERRIAQTLAAWAAIFEELKRDPDVKLPA